MGEMSLEALSGWPPYFLGGVCRRSFTIRTSNFWLCSSLFIWSIATDSPLGRSGFLHTRKYFGRKPVDPLAVFELGKRIMSPIHVNRDRQSLGQFSPEEVSAGLASGRFFPTDLGWSPGMEAWKHLSEFQDLPPAPQISPTTPSPEMEIPPQPVSSPLEPVWERRQEVGFLRALFQTIGGILTKPGEIFSKMRTEGDLVSPLLYTIILTVVVGVLTLPYSTFYNAALKHLVESLPNANSYPAALFQIQPLNLANAAMAIVLMPVLATVGSFIRASLLHLVLYLTGGANKGFEATFRVACYSDATAATFRIIPFLGLLIAFVLDLWLLIVGLKRVNQIEGWRATLAVLFLPLCCCVFMTAGVIFLAFSIAAKIH